jgi:hypothetical protein
MLLVLSLGAWNLFGCWSLVLGTWDFIKYQTQGPKTNDQKKEA